MPAMETAEQAQMGRQHIFVVNGAVEFLAVIQELLQDEHFNVTTTNFVPKTYDQIAALRPDLVILDLAVGEQAGWDLLERLAHEVATQQIPIIVVSTSTTYLARVEAEPIRYRAQRFFQKPFDLEALLAAIDELIGAA